MAATIRGFPWFGLSRHEYATPAFPGGTVSAQLQNYARIIRYAKYGAPVPNCDENNNANDIAKRVRRVVTCVSQIKSQKPSNVVSVIAADGTPLLPAGL